MTSLEAQAALADARKYASAAAYDIEQLDDKTVEHSALHNLQAAVDSLIQAIDGDSE